MSQEKETDPKTATVETEATKVLENPGEQEVYERKTELLNRIEELQAQYDRVHNEYELAKGAFVASVLGGVSDERGLEKEYFQHSPEHSNEELESTISRIESSIKETQEFTQRLKMLQQEEEEKLEVESSEEKEEEEIADDQEELVEEEAQTPVGEESPRLEVDSSQGGTVALDLEPEVASQEETLEENPNQLEENAGEEQTDEGGTQQVHMSDQTVQGDLNIRDVTQVGETRYGVDTTSSGAEDVSTEGVQVTQEIFGGDVSVSGGSISMNNVKQEVNIGEGHNSQNSGLRSVEKSILKKKNPAEQPSATEDLKRVEEEKSALDGLAQAVEAYEQGKRDKEMSDEEKNKLGEAYTKALGLYLESKGLSVNELAGEGAVDKILKMEGALLLDLDGETINLDTANLDPEKLEKKLTDLQDSLKKDRTLHFVLKEEDGEKKAYVLPPNSKYALLYAKVLAGDIEKFEGEEDLVQELRTKVATTQNENLKSTYTNILDGYDALLGEDVDVIEPELVEGEESIPEAKPADEEPEIIEGEIVEEEESGKTLPTESQAVAGGEDGEEVPEEEKAETEELPGALVKVETGGEIVLSGEGEKTSEFSEEIKNKIDFRISKIAELIRDKEHWGKEDFLSAMKTHLDAIARLVGGEFMPYVEEGKEGGILVFYEGDKRNSVEIKGYNADTPNFLRELCHIPAENMVTNDETVTPEAQESLKLQELKDFRTAYIQAEEKLLRMRESKIGVLGQLNTWVEKKFKHQDVLNDLENQYQTTKENYEAKFKEVLGEQVAKKQASEIHNMYMTEMQELRDTRKASIAEFATNQAEERKKRGQTFWGMLQKGGDKWNEGWKKYRSMNWKGKLFIGGGMTLFGMFNPFTGGLVSIVKGGMRFKVMQETALAGFEGKNMREIKIQVATIRERLEQSKANSNNVPLEQLEADRAFLEMLLRLDGLSEHEMKIDVADLEGEFAKLSTQINEAKIRIKETKGDQKKGLVNEMKTKQQRLKMLERLKMNQGHISALKELDEVIWEVSQKKLAPEVLDEVNSADEVDKEKLNTIQAEKYAELAQNLMSTLSSLKEKEQEKWNEKRKRQDRMAIAAGFGGVLLPYGVKGVWNAGLDDVAGEKVHQVMEKLGYDVLPDGEAPVSEAPGGQIPLDSGLENVPDTGTQIPLDSANGLDTMTDDQVWELGTQVPKDGVWNETLSKELAERGIPVMESEFGEMSELSGLGGSVNSILLKEFGGVGDRTVEDMAKAFNSERVLGVLDKYGFQGMDDGDVSFEELRQFFLEVQSGGGINRATGAQSEIHNAIIEQMSLNDLAEVMPVNSGDIGAAQEVLRGFFETHPDFEIPGVTDKLSENFWSDGIDRNEMIKIMEGARNNPMEYQRFMQELGLYNEPPDDFVGKAQEGIQNFVSPEAEASPLPEVPNTPTIEMPTITPEIQLSKGGTIWNTVEEKLMAAKGITSWENVDQGEVMGVVNEYLTSEDGKQALFDRAIETEAGRELLEEMGINSATDISSLDTAYDVARTIGPGELEGLDDVLAEHLGETGSRVAENAGDQVAVEVTSEPVAEVVPETQSAPTPDVTSEPSPIQETTPEPTPGVAPEAVSAPQPLEPVTIPETDMPDPPHTEFDTPAPEPIEWGQPLPEVDIPDATSPSIPAEPTPESTIVQEVVDNVPRGEVIGEDVVREIFESFPEDGFHIEPGENLSRLIDHIVINEVGADSSAIQSITKRFVTSDEGRQWLFEGLQNNEYVGHWQEFIDSNFGDYDWGSNDVMRINIILENEGIGFDESGHILEADYDKFSNLIDELTADSSRRSRDKLKLLMSVIIPPSGNEVPPGLEEIMIEELSTAKRTLYRT